jgi:hypothetical protein
VDSKMVRRIQGSFWFPKKEGKTTIQCSLIPKWRHVEDLETANDGGPVHGLKKNSGSRTSENRREEDYTLGSVLLR